MTQDPDPHLRTEEAIIQTYLAPLASGYAGAFGLKDDCAAFTPTPGHDLIVKTDPIASDVHFFPVDAPEDIAWKALAVNVSDLAAKAAEPRAYLMALSFPQAPTQPWMRRFAQGLAEAQAQFGLHLIGGDTDKRPGPITVSITVFGEVPAGTMIRRGTAQPSDLVYVSGTLGDAKAGLEILKSRDVAQANGFSDDAIAYLLSRFLRPQPRLLLRHALRNHATAAMDISDGLAKDLGRMVRASGCGASIDLARLPLSEPLRKADADASRSYPWRRAAVSAGDDYEILFTVRAGRGEALEHAASLAGIPVTCIGKMTVAPGLVIVGLDGRPIDLPYEGWDHF